jgi:hypothetical protein
MKRIGRVFLCAFFGAVSVGFSLSASAGFRLLHGSACDGGSCPIPTGDNFALNTINGAFVDARIEGKGCDTQTRISAQACRVNFASGVVSCGEASTATGAEIATFDLGLNLSAWTQASAFDDYGYIRVVNTTNVFTDPFLGPCPPSKLSVLGSFVTTP